MSQSHMPYRLAKEQEKSKQRYHKKYSTAIRKKGEIMKKENVFQILEIVKIIIP